MTNTVIQPGRSSARDRLLAAAGALFYEEGFHAVGIDRVIERAGVAKASLYYCFGSKEGLIRAYLLQRQASRRARLTDGLKHYATPRERLLGVFDEMGIQLADPGYRGCAFVKAGAEAVAIRCVKEVCDASRRWTRDLFAELAGAAGATDSAALAEQLVMVYDGASVAAQMDGNRQAAAAARRVAATLLDASLDTARR